MTANGIDPDIIAVHLSELAGHKEAWQWLLANKERYPKGKYIAPLQRPKHLDKPKKLAALQLEIYPDPQTSAPRPLALHYDDGEEWFSHELKPGLLGAKAICGLLFRHRNRGRLMVFALGKWQLTSLLAIYREPLVELGYTLRPIADRNDCKALIISKDKHSWIIATLESVLTQQVAEKASLLSCPSDVQARKLRTPATATLLALEGAQKLSISYLGSSLQMTLGLTAMRSAKQSLPEGIRKFKPPQLLVTMCRVGGAFRGGYTYASRYVGYAEQADVNRLYTAMLIEALPRSVGLGRGLREGQELQGVFMCTLSGRGSYPVYVSRFDFDTKEWSKCHVSGGKHVVILCQAEFEGIRRLGYHIDVGVGYVFRDTFNFAALVDNLQKIIDAYGKKSPQSAIAKGIGNAIYGKLGTSPVRGEYIFARDRPDRSWCPYIDVDCAEIPNLWVRQTVKYTSNMHPDIAATITAYARSLIYSAMADVSAVGGRILHVSTDSIIGTTDLSQVLDVDAEQIGKWRLEGRSPIAHIASLGVYEIGDKVRVMGVLEPPPDLVRHLARGGELHVEEAWRTRPWTGEQYRVRKYRKNPAS